MTTLKDGDSKKCVVYKCKRKNPLFCSFVIALNTPFCEN